MTKTLIALRFRQAILAVTALFMVALAGTACLERAGIGGRVPGVSEDQVLFGQSAVMSGPSQGLGKGMRLGIETAFFDANQAGGIHGRQLKLKSLDDGYELDYAIHTTEWLIETEQVFALIGGVGTPTSRVAAPLAQDSGVPFVGAYTGAEFLRDPALDNVINVRASYYQEAEQMVRLLTEHLEITHVGVLYQDDSFGWNGVEGIRQALERRALEPHGLWRYQRNADVPEQVPAEIVAANPEAVIIIGTHRPIAATVEIIRREIDPIIMTVSFGGGAALAEALGKGGQGVYVTQVVPFPEDESLPLVARYQAALARYSPQAKPGFVSLEGYLVGRVAIFALEFCGPKVDRKCFMEALRTAEVIDVDGFRLEYGPGDNQGSDAVFLTVIRPDGKYRRVDRPERGH